MAIPILKLSQVFAVCISHRHQEIIAGHCLPIMALEIQIHTLTETIPTKQGLVHPDHLRALLIDGNGIEVINLLILIRTNWMRHRTRIFWELELTQ